MSMRILLLKKTPAHVKVLAQVLRMISMTDFCRMKLAVPNL